MYIYSMWIAIGFRNQVLNAVRGFSMSRQNGLFINSCFAHCQTERQDTWFADDSPVVGNKVHLMCPLLCVIWEMDKSFDLNMIAGNCHSCGRLVFRSCSCEEHRLSLPLWQKLSQFGISVEYFIFSYILSIIYWKNQLHNQMKLIDR